MSYSIVWIIRNEDDPLSGAEGLSDMAYLPYYKDNSIMRELYGGVSRSLRGLSSRAPAGREDSPLQSMLAPLTDFHYRRAMELVAGSVRLLTCLR